MKPLCDGFFGRKYPKSRKTMKTKNSQNFAENMKNCQKGKMTQIDHLIDHAIDHKRKSRKLLAISNKQL